jgi:hypothetical protein
MRRRFFTIQTCVPVPKKEDVMKSSGSRLSRRNFLLAVGAGSVATAATVVATRQRNRSKKAAAVTGSKGYQLTEHVRKYYDTTKV